MYNLSLGSQENKTDSTWLDSLYRVKSKC